MGGLWVYKTSQQTQKPNLPGEPLPPLHVNTKTSETVLLFIIALLLLSLIWVSNFGHRCHPNHRDHLTMGIDKNDRNKDTLSDNLRVVQNDGGSRSNEQVQDGIDRMESKVYQSAPVSIVLYHQTVDSPPPSCTASAECSIQCSDYPAKNFHEMVDFINQQFQSCDQGDLTITGTNFNNRTIQSGWLKDLKMQVTQLKLVNNLKCNAAHVGRGAFSGDPFDSLTYLTMEEADLKYVEKKVFEDCQLSNVEIRHNEQRATKFEAGVFEQISSTLKMLQLQRCISGAEALRNITGAHAVTMSALIQLDLRWNVIPELTSDVFTKVGMVSNIFLDFCAIESIDVHTFDFLRNLRQLTLGNNMLSTLPEHVFSQTTLLAKIGLQDNPWICDCYLAWLKVMYMAKKKIFIKALYCGGIEFDKAEFICTSTSSATTQSAATSTTEQTRKTTHTSLITTTRNPTDWTTGTEEVTTTAGTTPSTTDSPTTSVAPTQSPPGIKNVRCQRFRSAPFFNSDDAVELHLEKSNCTLSFVMKDESSSVSCDIKLAGDVDNTIMNFLLRDLANNELKCYAQISYNSTFTFDHLDYNKSYLGCLLTDNGTDVNPYNCIAITTPLSYKDRTWLTNDFKTIAIVGLVVASALFILVSVFIIYCCHRQRPQLVVDSQPQFLVPRASPYQEYAAPSYRSISDGYLTPRTVRSDKYYEMPLSPSRYRRKSFQVSYQSPGYIGRYSFMRRRNSTHNSEPLYEIPPPLPPNHPAASRYTPHSEISQFM